VPDDPSPTYTSYANVHLHLEGARLRARAALRAQPDLIRSQASAALAAPTQPGEGGALPINGDAETQLYSAIGQGPRVLVVGPESAGKSSLVKLLANYALRSPAVCSTGLEEEGKEKDSKSAEESEVTGWWPTVVNLDPSAVSSSGCSRSGMRLHRPAFRAHG
jgi:polyribonucleotide 5'-hydroxyl-kinase